MVFRMPHGALTGRVCLPSHHWSCWISMATFMFGPIPRPSAVEISNHLDDDFLYLYTLPSSILLSRPSRAKVKNYGRPKLSVEAVSGLLASMYVQSLPGRWRRLDGSAISLSARSHPSEERQAAQVKECAPARLAMLLRRRLCDVPVQALLPRAGFGILCMLPSAESC